MITAVIITIAVIASLIFWAGYSVGYAIGSRRGRVQGINACIDSAVRKATGRFW